MDKHFLLERIQSEFPSYKITFEKNFDNSESVFIDGTRLLMRWSHPSEDYLNSLSLGESIEEELFRLLIVSIKEHIKGKE